jgi:hypothetical protein
VSEGPSAHRAARYTAEGQGGRAGRAHRGRVRHASGKPNPCLPRLNKTCPNPSKRRESLGFRVTWPDRRGLVRSERTRPARAAAPAFAYPETQRLPAGDWAAAAALCAGPFVRKALHNCQRRLHRGVGRRIARIAADRSFRRDAERDDDRRTSLASGSARLTQSSRVLAGCPDVGRPAACRAPRRRGRDAELLMMRLR